MDPHHDRQAALVVPGARGGEDVQVEAVLRCAGHAEPGWRLRAVRPECRGRADPGPGCGGVRGTPPQSPDWRGSVRDTEELIHPAGYLAAKRPGGRGDEKARVPVDD